MTRAALADWLHTIANFVAVSALVAGIALIAIAAA